jgi:hypothetical protein
MVRDDDEDVDPDDSEEVDLPAPFSNDTTSRDAAEFITDSGINDDQKSVIMDLLQRARDERNDGYTDHELNEETGFLIRQCNARRNLLMKEGRVGNSHTTRPGPTRFKNIVWWALRPDEPREVCLTRAQKAAIEERAACLELVLRHTPVVAADLATRAARTLGLRIMLAIEERGPCEF